MKNDFLNLLVGVNLKDNVVKLSQKMALVDWMRCPLPAFTFLMPSLSVVHSQAIDHSNLRKNQMDATELRVFDLFLFENSSVFFSFFKLTIFQIQWLKGLVIHVLETLNAPK